MAVPSINTTGVPTTMSTRGQYRFFRQRVGNVNGSGVAKAAGPQMVAWIFGYMTQAELEWWNNTMMSDADSITLTAAELWDDEMQDKTFTSGVLYRPQFDVYRGGLYWNVTVEIKHLLPIL